MKIFNFGKRRKLTHAPLILLVIYCSSCAGPVHTFYETGTTLGKGRMELAADYTGNESNNATQENTENFDLIYRDGILSGDAGSYKFAGIKLGYGLTRHVDLKLRYQSVFGNGYSSDYFSIMPKLRFGNTKLALLVPFSQYTLSSSQPELRRKDKMYSIAPQLIITGDVLKEKFDISFSTKTDFIIAGQANASNEFLAGFALGFGSSSNLEEWALRGEISYLFKPGTNASVLGFGIGIQTYFRISKKAGRKG